MAKEIIKEELSGKNNQPELNANIKEIKNIVTSKLKQPSILALFRPNTTIQTNYNKEDIFL